MSAFGAMIRSLTEGGKEKAEGVGTFLKKRFRSESGESVFGFGDPMARDDMDRMNEYTSKLLAGQSLTQPEAADMKRIQIHSATVGATTFGMTAPVARGAGEAARLAGMTTQINPGLQKGVLGTPQPTFRAVGSAQLRRIPGQLSAITRAATKQGIAFPPAGRAALSNIMNPRTTEQMLRMMRGF